MHSEAKILQRWLSYTDSADKSHVKLIQIYADYLDLTQPIMCKEFFSWVLSDKHSYYAHHGPYNMVICKKGTKLHFKSPTAERRHASCVGGWRGSNPRRPAPMEQGMPALTSRLLLACIMYKFITYIAPRFYYPYCGIYIN